MNTNTYFAQLPEDLQSEILQEVKNHLEKNGHSVEEIKEALENVKCDRLWVIEDIVDIKKYIGGK